MPAALRRLAPTGCRASQNIEDSTVAAAFERDGTHNKQCSDRPAEAIAHARHCHRAPTLIDRAAARRCDSGYPNRCIQRSS
jgi:hypothetical protein